MRYMGRAKPFSDKRFNFMTADIETGRDKIHNSPLLGECVYISWCEDFEGYGLKSDNLTKWMIENFLTESRNEYILYVHNGFGFDYKRIDYTTLARYGYEASFLSGNDGAIKSVTITKESFVWYIRDSYLLIPQSLAKVTKTFAPKQQKIKRKHSFDSVDFNPDDESDCEYAIQDSVALFHAIVNFDDILITRFNISVHECATLPALAFKAFRRMFDKGEKYPGISFGMAHAARDSYHGGQTIAFKTAPYRDVVSIDANSMYSHVMLRYPLPTGEVKRYTGYSESADPNRTLCLAVVNIPDNVFPLLKSIDKDNRTGNYKGVVTGWYWLFELKEQEVLGASFDVVESYEWEESTDVCFRFVEKCRLLRMSDYYGAVGSVAKLLANALYGKFAQQVAETLVYLSMQQPEESVPIYDPHTQCVQESLWYVPSSPSFRADMTHWASYITARARMVLTSAIKMVGFENVIYCDTDSVFFERKYLHKVESILGKEYGQFKLEKGKENKGINFQAFAPKAYIYQTENNEVKVKNKGIPVKSILKQDGIRRIGFENESVDFISSNNLMQKLKRNAPHGRSAHRRMATEKSTTNGAIENSNWIPRTCEVRELKNIRGDEKFNRKTPFYLKMKYDRMIDEYLTKGGKKDWETNALK